MLNCTWDSHFTSATTGLGGVLTLSGLWYVSPDRGTCSLRLAQNIVVPCGALMVFPPKFCLSGLFGCHLAWPNMGGKIVVRFPGARKFVGEFFFSKGASDVGSDSWAN